jgi:hypothetical protein
MKEEVRGQTRWGYLYTTTGNVSGVDNAKTGKESLGVREQPHETGRKSSMCGMAADGPVGRQPSAMSERGTRCGSRPTLLDMRAEDLVTLDTGVVSQLQCGSRACHDDDYHSREREEVSYMMDRARYQ